MKKRKAHRGMWVQIHKVALPPRERSDRLPADTARVPLELRIKGFLCNAQAVPGDEVTIKTATGRKVKGKLTAICPAYNHNFGECQPELLAIGGNLRRLLAFARVLRGKPRRVNGKATRRSRIGEDGLVCPSLARASAEFRKEMPRGFHRRPRTMARQVSREASLRGVKP